jgi:hypothetical protein
MLMKLEVYLWRVIKITQIQRILYWVYRSLREKIKTTRQLNKFYKKHLLIFPVIEFTCSLYNYLEKLEILIKHLKLLNKVFRNIKDSINYG